MNDPISRRHLLASTMAAGAAYALKPLSHLHAEDKTEVKPQPQMACFTKSFQDWSIPEVCQRFKSIGLDGLDLTVRKNGHINPDKQNVHQELKQAARAADDSGMKILFLTTDITEPNARAEEVLAAAEAIGIRKIKLGYYKYNGFGNLQQQMDQVKQKLASVGQLCARYNVLPCVHIHSGTSIPSDGFMLYELLKDIDPDHVGAYVDALHMTLEGAGDGWRQGLDLLAPWVALCSIKNFQFKAEGRDEQGQLKWDNYNCPVADGITPMPRFMQTMKTIGFTGTYSLHSEYKGGGSFKDLTTEECLEQTDRDLKFVRSLM
ncbi:Xylose isomerase-like TIM barrel [Polystyrenella longa]|uniref:Xylose isomerase-like TIM barrel n=1 Tax=Polystyrenella longa TaxID=2528007 RepID=A0A518CMC8_9PLAN|nr:TIM barrel protein [Polystyrenella longa]QDU80386.1 Xylose isomerase-like TIM barrel [Polystyrenella longa]